MKILNLVLDNSILDRTSALAARVVEYGNLVEKYTIMAPSRRADVVELSPNVKACGSGGGNKPARFFRIYQTAKTMLAREKYSVITVQDQYYLALIGLRLAKKYKIGLEIQAHGFERFYGLRKLIAQYVLPRANAVRCVSQRLKKQLIGQFGVKEEKITVAPIYVDTVLSLPERRSNLAFVEFNQRLPRRPDYGAPRNDTNAFIFLTVGRLAPVKNMGMQIEAMAEIVKKYPSAELWIAGDGPERKNYELRITNYELEKNIKLLGWKNNLAEYYNKADAFMLTSDSEGWGLAVIEIARFGLPIIMTDVGCAGEVIENEKSGLVIPVGDGKALELAMEKIIESKDLRLALAAGAKEAVGKLPNQEETLKLYRESWQKALD